MCLRYHVFVNIDFLNVSAEIRRVRNSRGGI